MIVCLSIPSTAEHTREFKAFAEELPVGCPYFEIVDGPTRGFVLQKHYHGTEVMVYALRGRMWHHVKGIALAFKKWMGAEEAPAT